MGSSVSIINLSEQQYATNITSGKYPYIHVCFRIGSNTPYIHAVRKAVCFKGSTSLSDGAALVGPVFSYGITRNCFLEGGGQFITLNRVQVIALSQHGDGVRGEIVKRFL
jgi:hypothetical protein